MHLITATRQLILQAETTRAMLLKSQRPCFLPAGHNQERALIAEHISALYPNSATQKYSGGIICLEPDEIKTIEALNRAKLEFKKAVQQLRAQGIGEKSRLDKLLERAAHQEGRRTDTLLNELRELGIQHFDLLHCYRQIRVLPSQLNSIRWTWAKKHASIVRISYDEAVAMAEALESSSAQQAALLQLQTQNQHTSFALKKTLPNQLRANLSWGKKPDIERKMVTASGIFISPDPKLPACHWRDDPGPSMDTDRKIRNDLSIEPEPFIKALNLYRYEDNA